MLPVETEARCLRATVPKGNCREFEDSEVCRLPSHPHVPNPGLDFFLPGLYNLMLCDGETVPGAELALEHSAGYPLKAQRIRNLSAWLITFGWGKNSVLYCLCIDESSRLTLFV